MHENLFTRLRVCVLLLATIFSIPAFADETNEAAPVDNGQIYDIHNTLLNEEQNFIQFVQGIEMFYEMDTNYKGLNNRKMIQSLMVTPSQVKAGQIMNGFGGTITVSSTTWSAPEKYYQQVQNIPYNAFSVAYTGLPRDACELFFQSTVKYFNEINVNDQPAFIYDGDMKPKVITELSGKLCQDSNNTMTFIHSKQ